MWQHAKNTPSTHFCLVYSDNMINWWRPSHLATRSSFTRTAPDSSGKQGSIKHGSVVGEKHGCPVREQCLCPHSPQLLLGILCNLRFSLFEQKSNILKKLKWCQHQFASPPYLKRHEIFMQRQQSYNLHLKTSAWKETREYLMLEIFGGILCLLYFLATQHK